jgi:hypothetical protein
VIVTDISVDALVVRVNTAELTSVVVVSVRLAPELCRFHGANIRAVDHVDVEMCAVLEHGAGRF